MTTYTQAEIDVLVLAVKKLQDEIHRKEKHHQDIYDTLCDAAYRRGMRAGWNFCLRNDEEGFKEAIEAHKYK